MRHRPLRFALGGALALAVGGFACSGATVAVQADPCAPLSACCDTLSGVNQSVCRQFVSAGRDQGAGSTCTTEFQSFQQSGLCGGSNLGFDASVPNVDASLPCQLPGNCVSTADAGVPNDGFDAGGGVSTMCQATGSCSSGALLQTCVTNGPGSACSAFVLLPSGSTFPCQSCANCAAASAQAEQACPQPPPIDAGPVCGLPPTLHPEVEAGVYCPFTAAGAVHCVSGQQCCEAPSTAGPASTCATGGTTCPLAGSIAWSCNGPADCAGSARGPVCCAAGTVTVAAVCGYNLGSGISESHCSQGCATGELTICDGPNECSPATTCTPFKVAGLDLGACQ